MKKATPAAHDFLTDGVSNSAKAELCHKIGMAFPDQNLTLIAINYDHASSESDFTVTGGKLMIVNDIYSYQLIFITQTATDVCTAFGYHGTYPLALNLSGLQYLEVVATNSPTLQQSPILTGLTRLTVFAMYSSLSLGETPNLDGLKSLRYFLMVNTPLGQAPLFDGLYNLRYLIMGSNSNITSINSLADCKLLQQLDLSDNTSLTETPSLAGLTHLNELNLQNTAITLPPAIEGLNLLHQVNLYNCSSLTAPPTFSVGSSQALQSLDLSDCPLITGTQVDTMYNTLVGATFATNGACFTGGTTGNASDTGMGNSYDARQTLIHRGWTFSL